MSEQELRDLKYKLKEFIKSNDIEHVFVEVNRVLPQQNSKTNIIASIESRYNTWKSKQAKGVLSFEENTLYENRIKDNLLEFINGLSSFDFKVSTHHPQYKKIFPPLDRINCDRKEVVAKFKDRLYEKEKCGCSCQHYFLLSPRRQHPHSVVERLIYDLEADGKHIHYQKNGEHNILINLLPAHSNLSQGKLELKKLIHKKFEHYCEQLGELLQAKPRLDKHDYIVKILRLNMNDDWHRHSLELFQWFIEEFCTLQTSSNAKFLFFYIIDTELLKSKNVFNLWRKPQNKLAMLRQDLLQLQEKCNESFTLLPELGAVSKKDFLQWISDKITHNEYKSENILEEIYEQLSEKQRKRAFASKDGESLYMAFIEAQIDKLIESK